MALKLIEAPEIYPITAIEVQEHLRMSDDEALDMATTLELLIAGAVAFVEDYTWRALITQTWDYFIDEWPKSGIIELPKAPLQSVTGVYYTPNDDTEEEFSDYLVDTDSEPGRVVLKKYEAWPTDTLTPSNPIRIRFVAGYGTTAASVPVRIKQAILLHIAENYDVIDNGGAIDAILYNYRIVRW